MTGGEVNLKQQVGIRRAKSQGMLIWGVVTRSAFMEKGYVPTVFLLYKFQRKLNYYDKGVTTLEHTNS